MIDLAALWMSVLANEGEDLLRKMDEAARHRPGWRAEVRVERAGKRAETRSASKGAMVVRAGEPARLEMPGRRAVQGGGAEFHPLDLWGGERLSDRFRISLVQRSGEEGGAVTEPTGAPRPAPVVRLRRAGSLVAAAGTAPEVHVLSLVPRDAGLRERILEIRLFVEPGTLRPVRAEVETVALVETWALGRIDEIKEDGR